LKEIEEIMGNKIVTEADRKRTPATKLAEGLGFRKESKGQKISLERGTSTRSKKNPGKRPHKGG
jgi:U3 small nucleolar RNA-associated protein 14